MRDMCACSEQPDFIISESLMPSMTWLRIARLLKFDERYKNIPFILLSDNDLASSKNILHQVAQIKY